MDNEDMFDAAMRRSIEQAKNGKTVEVDALDEYFASVVLPVDTSPEAWEVWRDTIRAMSVEKRADMLEQLTRVREAISEAGRRDRDAT